MKRYVVLTVLITLAAAGCSKTAGISDEGTNALRIASKPAIVLHYAGDRESAVTAARFLRDALRVLKHTAPGRTNAISMNYTGIEDPYVLYYILGDAYFSEYRNKPVVYSLLQIEWQKRVDSGAWRAEADGLTYGIRLPEMQALIDKYNLTPGEKKDFYLYINDFLLREIYFVSVQEMMERNFLYFTPEAVKTVFYQAVISAEMTEFTKFLIAKYGMAKVVQAARADYAKDTWKAMFGEDVSDVERSFVQTFDKKAFPGRLSQTDFVTEADKMLTLFNTGTKSSLFQRSR